MLSNICSDIQIVDWSVARSSIENVNPELARIIDKLSPSENYQLIKATYSYGDLIVENGKLQLPIKKGRLAPITHPDLNKSLAATLLNYSPIPLTILLNKASEIFITSGEYVVPLKFFTPGNLFGTFELLNYLTSHTVAPRWNVSAGSRSFFSLPKISDATGFKRLKKHFNVKSDQPRSMSDHWSLFQQMANASNFEQPWTSEVIFFTQDWFTFYKMNDPSWQEFQLFLFKAGWSQAQSLFNKESIGALWREFINSISQRRLSPPPYIIDTLKHLFLVSIGEMPAFQPASSSDVIAPCLGLQKAMLDIYGLKKYVPTLMHAISYSNHMNTSPMLYYSLAFPTLSEGCSDKNYRSSTLMFDLKDLKLLIDTILKNTEVIANSFLKNTVFDFFHIQEENEIKSSSLITENDPLFKDSRYSQLSFCQTSPFWRGCVRIQKL